MKKKFLLICILIIISVVTFGAINAFATTVEQGTCGNSLTWTLDDSGTLTISGQGEMHTYYSWNNEYVPWDELKSNIKTIIIDEGVTSVSYAAFSKCVNLTQISLPDSMLNIQSDAFKSCEKLAEIIVPNGIVTIGSNAFENCISLNSISLPDEAIAIGNKAFSNTAFFNNSSNWEDNVLYIDKHLVKANSNFSTSSYTVKIETITIGDGAFDGCALLSDIDIPNSVKRLGWRTFAYCTNLKNVIFPSSITSTDEFTFLGCSNLENIYITDLEAWCKLNFGAGYANPLSNAKNLYVNNSLVTVLTIPDSISHINNYSFYGLDSLEKVIIPDTVTSIGREPFGNCENLLEINIGKGVSSITDDTIPNNVSLTISDENAYFSFGDGALYNKEKTKLIQFFDDGSRIDYTIPDTVTSIEKWAFQNCTNLETVTIGDGLTTIGQYAFSYCMSLKNINLGDNVRIISSQAFYNCQNLQNITIPDSVTTIGNDAFLNCRNLNSVTIGQNVRSIGYQTFCQCVALTGINIPVSVTSIGGRAFESCINLTDVSIGDSVKYIYDRAFFGCDKLSSVHIPMKVVSIGKSVFDACDKLTDVYYSGTPEEWSKTSIDSNNEPLTNAKIYFIPNTRTTRSNNNKSFTITPINIENGKTIILALYNGEQFVEMQSTVYTGEEIPFTTTKSYTKAKVMVWDDLMNLTPICDVETIE